MVSFIHNGNEITTQIWFNFKIKTFWQKQKLQIPSNVFKKNICFEYQAADHQISKQTLELHANSQNKIFLQPHLSKKYLADCFNRGCFFLSIRWQESLAYRVMMLTILAKCLHSCLLICLCGNREYPKQISKPFFQMSAQLYSVPGQTEGRMKAFLEQGNAQSYLYVEGVMLTIIKELIIPFLLKIIGNILVVFKINQ